MHGGMIIPTALGNKITISDKLPEIPLFLCIGFYQN